MTDYSRIKQFLGLCNRAGKLISGEQLVIEAIRNKKAKFVLLASDTGQATKKKVINKAQYYQIPYEILLTSEEYALALGKVRKTFAVVDNGFAIKLQEMIEKGD